MNQIGGDWGSSWDYGGVYSDGETAYAIDGMELEYTDREEPEDPKQQLYRWEHDQYWGDYMNSKEDRDNILSTVGMKLKEFLHLDQAQKWLVIASTFGYHEFDNNGFEGPLYVTESEWEFIVGNEDEITCDDCTSSLHCPRCSPKRESWGHFDKIRKEKLENLEIDGRLKS